MKLSRKPKFDQGLSVLENISQQRNTNSNREHKRYVIQQTLYFLRVLALLALAYWGYTTRQTIHAFIVDIFTHPKIIP